jgi:hypothetical protein
MSSGKIEQATRLREQADQLWTEAKGEERKRIAGLREDLKKADRAFDVAYGTKKKTKRSSESPEAKVSSNPLMDEEVARIYERGLQMGITDAKSLKAFLDPQLKRRIAMVNKVVDAWGNAGSDARSTSEKFLAFFKSFKK